MVFLFSNSNHLQEAYTGLLQFIAQKHNLFISSFYWQNSRYYLQQISKPLMMKKTLLIAAVLFSGLLGACQKEKNKSTSPEVLCPNNPRTDAPPQLQSGWMNGNFSMTEYWSQYPGDYLGPALQFAFAFKFYPNGTYEQYFTFSTVESGLTTYHQSVTKGTVAFDHTNQTFTTYGCTSHYKRTANRKTVEDRDLLKSEMSGPTTYSYTLNTQSNGTKALHLTKEGTNQPLTFFEKPL